MRTIKAYGYEVTGPEEIITEIEENLKDRGLVINWINFENGESLWNDNGDTEYQVEIDNESKTVRLIG